MNIILASTSPRRHDLLKTITTNFEIASPHFDEESIKQNNAKKLVEQLSFGKAKAVFEKSKGDWCVIGADTVVCLKSGEILGKPKNKHDAKQMLKKISDTTHYVLTGVCVLYRKEDSEHKISFVKKTKVVFKKLNDAEIDDYIASKEPMDKAGAYAIQGLAGKFVKKVNGSFSNIIGLPTEQLYEILLQEQII
ncbi:MAG: septum formation protein Maf [Clostridia bacterium]|nr:septum formation protein Maf [Clostridia bacterium]